MPPTDINISITHGIQVNGVSIHELRVGKLVPNIIRCWVFQGKIGRQR